MTKDDYSKELASRHEGDLFQQRSMLLKLAGEVLPVKVGEAAEAATGSITVTEKGSAQSHVTVIDIADLSLLATTAAAVAGGKGLYEFPAGNLLIKHVAIAIGVVGSDDPSLNEDDTPDLGLGTTVATGSVAVLGGTAGFENILTGQTMGDCQGAVKSVGAAVNLNITAASEARTAFLNIADTWAGIDAGMKATGRVVLEWVEL